MDLHFCHCARHERRNELLDKLFSYLYFFNYLKVKFRGCLFYGLDRTSQTGNRKFWVNLLDWTISQIKGLESRSFQQIGFLHLLTLKVAFYETLHFTGMIKV